MCVHPSYRQAGLSTDLVGMFEKVLTENNFISAYLETLEEGPPMDFYSSLEFRKIALVMMKNGLS